MRPIQRTFDPTKKRAIPLRLSPAPVPETLQPQMTVIDPADSEMLELEGDAAQTAWSDSVFVTDFTLAFEDSVPAHN